MVQEALSDLRIIVVRQVEENRKVIQTKASSDSLLVDDPLIVDLSQVFLDLLLVLPLLLLPSLIGLLYDLLGFLLSLLQLL